MVDANPIGVLIRRGDDIRSVHIEKVMRGHSGR